MKVLKFGGSSVGSPESILQVIEILKDNTDQQKLVVLSAFQGTTDGLTQCTLLASVNDQSYIEELATIEHRHLQMIASLLPNQDHDSLSNKVKSLFEELGALLHGVSLLKEATAKTKDNILSHGERLSTLIVQKVIESKGVNSVLLDSRTFIKTDDSYGNAIVDFKKTEELIKSTFDSIAQLGIVPGFIASAPDGSTSTLGRGGSDYTAAILAAILKVEILEIWTDVDGMLTASPLKVSTAIPIDELSYEEAMELSHFGAKVIYPPTIQPVMDAGVPIRIKNTFNPSAKGTLIQKEVSNHKHLISGLSSIEDVALLTLSGSGMVGIPGFAQRMFGALALKNVNVILITQASSEHSISIVIETSDIKRASKMLENEFAFEMSLRKVNKVKVKKNRAIVALVGDSMKRHIGVSGRAFSVLGQNGVNINAIAQGSTERNISIVIDQEDVKKSLNILHEKFFLSHLKKINLYVIGIGGVGRELINQISDQQEYLKSKHHLELRMIGVANSKKMLFDQSGIDLHRYKEDLMASGDEMKLEDFLSKMNSDNLRNSVFIDNTSNEGVAKAYLSILKNNLSIVTPNKIAASQDFASYVALKNQALDRNVKFLYETNVGAGLPVINTMIDLKKSGDEVTKIEAVLSGSLNFIFNKMIDESMSFGDIVEIAMKEGYTEPDPRIDLSGVDVQRKILILARESGKEVEMSDIDGSSFLPEECLACESVEEFVASLHAHQDHFEQMKKDTLAVNGKLRYIAKFENGKLSAGLETVGEDHPFYRLNGTDNILLLTTKRYNKFPLVIQGAGAGTEVTAAGVFSDIMRIANR
jgi:aspartokinase/homoserine dehydrogenase 1